MLAISTVLTSAVKDDTIFTRCTAPPAASTAPHTTASCTHAHPAGQKEGQRKGEGGF
jgi:hypothetical protein